MENSNILAFPVKRRTIRCEFSLMDSLLRYVYEARKKTFITDETEAQERSALQHTYYCRAALKRRLKQIAMYEHELKD